MQTHLASPNYMQRTLLHCPRRVPATVSLGYRGMRNVPNTMNPAPPEIHHPLLKAAEIEAALINRSHTYNPDASTVQAPISDMVGMSELGVTFLKLPPGAESSAPHYHLNDHEWVYIISGSGHLRLINAALPVHTNQKGRPLRSAAATRLETGASTDAEASLASLSLAGGHNGSGAKVQKQDLYDEEYRPVAPGDFAGFMGGIKAGKYTHSLVAGEEGMTYLCGGTRKAVDVCSYPIVGKTIIFDEAEGDTILTPVPRSGSPTPLPPKQ